MSCPQIVESDKTPLEIAHRGDDSLGGSLKLPDPWLFDSEALLRELDRIRETALQVPTNGDANATTPKWRALTEEEMFYAAATAQQAANKPHD
jgi:hypothetical protein